MGSGQPMPLRSFGDDMHVVVVGASGGIGQALTLQLALSGAVGRITACSRSRPGPEHPKVRHQRLDLTDEVTIASAAETVAAQGGAPDLVLVATGILHDGDALRPEKTWRALDGAALERVYRINAVGPPWWPSTSCRCSPRIGRAFSRRSRRAAAASRRISWAAGTAIGHRRRP